VVTTSTGQNQQKKAKKQAKYVSPKIWTLPIGVCHTVHERVEDVAFDRKLHKFITRGRGSPTRYPISSFYFFLHPSLTEWESQTEPYAFFPSRLVSLFMTLVYWGTHGSGLKKKMLLHLSYVSNSYLFY
jgi:hypothetical protein